MLICSVLALCLFVQNILASERLEKSIQTFDSFKLEREESFKFDAANPLASTETLDIFMAHYSYGGNFKALVCIPKARPDNYKSLFKKKIKGNQWQPTKLPIVVYSYDQFVDLVGWKNAAKKGYDLVSFLKKFGSWGFVTVIPIEKHRTINAVKGAIKYAQELPETDEQNVHIVGVSEGALSAMISASVFPSVKTITVISPQLLTYTGAQSLPGLARKVGPIDAQLMLMGLEVETNLRNSIADTVFRLFKEQGKDIQIKAYRQNKKWFWNPDNIFMKDIHEFISQDDPYRLYKKQKRMLDGAY